MSLGCRKEQLASLVLFSSYYALSGRSKASDSRELTSNDPLFHFGLIVLPHVFGTVKPAEAGQRGENDTRGIETKKKSENSFG